MALPTALLVKGLAGLGIVAAGTTGLVFILRNDPNKEINDKIKKLGIEDTNCHFTGKKTSVSCDLDKTKLEKVKFEKIGGNFADTASASLTISIVTGVEAEDYTENLKFTLKNTSTGTSNNDLTLGSNSDTITLKKDVGYDFKIKTVGSETKLEKAWDLTSLAKKVGLTCTNGGSSTTCTLPTTGKINVWKDQSNYILEATVDTSSSSNMTVTKDTANYNQGFKLTVSSDTNLTQETQNKKEGSLTKLTKDNTTYEIDLKDHNGTKKWFLVEKTA